MITDQKKRFRLIREEGGCAVKSGFIFGARGLVALLRGGVPLGAFHELAIIFGARVLVALLRGVVASRGRLSLPMLAFGVGPAVSATAPAVVAGGAAAFGLWPLWL